MNRKALDSQMFTVVVLSGQPSKLRLLGLHLNTFLTQK